MSLINTAAIPVQFLSPSTTLIENRNRNSQSHVSFLQQLHIRPGQHRYQHKLKKVNMNTTDNTSLPSPITDRTPANLLELKQQRLSAAADRKKRIITRLISIIGLLIILLCAVIVTLTLKMAPKIDELVRTKTGAHQTIHHISRMTSPSPSITIELNNFTTNNSSIIKSTFRTRRKLFFHYN